MVNVETTMIYVNQYRNDQNLKESFHKSFNFLIRFANCLGLLPITGLSSVDEIKFNWKSWKGIYAIVIATVYISNTIICVVNWTFVRFSFRLLARQMHQINAFLSVVLYFRLAQKWPKFAKLWNEVDKKMQRVYGYPRNLDFRIRIVTIVIIMASVGEYLLLLSYQVLKITTIDNREFTFENYYLIAFPELFSVISYNKIGSSIASIASIIGRMIWSFNDLFIIALSIALALRFKQISHRLFMDEKKANSNNYWIEIRADYDRLVHLARKLDKYISYIVLLSYSANIFFLLIQLSNVIGHFDYDIQVFYYTYSFSFLIARLVAVSLYGAWIADESKEPAVCLNSVPSATYNLEIRRLLLQISFNDVAITGSKMFKVTRGLLLHVAGAIVTYELVMIQFNDNEG